MNREAAVHERDVRRLFFCLLVRGFVQRLCFLALFVLISCPE